MGVSDFIVIGFQAYVHKSVMEELKRIIDDSEITKEDDALWPPPDRVGRQVCAKRFF